MSQLPCPACGASALVLASARGPIDRVRKLFTAKRPHRCPKCGWTGWTKAVRRRHHAQAWTVAREPPDLGGLDAALLAEDEQSNRSGTARPEGDRARE